jgi:membrane protein DedA with SNARE-associated domain
MLLFFFYIIKNVFLSFFIIPFASGTMYKVGISVFGVYIAFLAKILGIFLALCVNYFIGFLFCKIFKLKRREDSKLLNILPIFCFIPVISGLISFYFGASNQKFKLFIKISLIANIIYYALAIKYPFLSIYF